MGDRILTEAGTNEMELLVFRVGETLFGVNVAKVRELIQRLPTVRVPKAPPAVRGSFKLREEVLSLVDLGSYLELNGEASRDDDAGLIIILELNNIRCGVLVDAVEMIHRVSWDKVEPPPAYLADMSVPLTAIARITDRVIQILDFETVLGRLLGTGGTDVVELDASQAEPLGEFKATRILVADDSPTIRASVEKVLHNSGFEHVTLASDGQEAWEKLDAARSEDPFPFDLLLTDIEMPRMDGLHLTSRVKRDPDLSALKVVLFSSLISSENANKGNAVGADAQITKFQTEELTRVLKELIGVPDGAA